MGVASLVLSIVGAFFAMLGLVPLLGWINWIALLLLVLAVIFGIVGTVKGPKKGLAIAGLVIGAVFLIESFIRLVAGGGIV